MIDREEQITESLQFEEKCKFSVEVHVRVWVEVVVRGESGTTIGREACSQSGWERLRLRLRHIYLYRIAEKVGDYLSKLRSCEQRIE